MFFADFFGRKTPPNHLEAIKYYKKNCQSQHLDLLFLLFFLMELLVGVILTKPVTLFFFSECIHRRKKFAISGRDYRVIKFKSNLDS
jgi:hypothetical protein